MRKRQQNPADIAAEPGPHEPMTGPRSGPGDPAQSLGLWGVAEVAAYLRVPRNTVYKLAARAVSKIPHIRIGSRMRFRRADVDRWLSRLSVSSDGRQALIQKKVQQVINGNHSQEGARER